MRSTQMIIVGLWMNCINVLCGLYFWNINRAALLLAAATGRVGASLRVGVGGVGVGGGTEVTDR